MGKWTFLVPALFARWVSAEETRFHFTLGGTEGALTFVRFRFLLAQSAEDRFRQREHRVVEGKVQLDIKSFDQFRLISQFFDQFLVVCFYPVQVITALFGAGAAFTVHMFDLISEGHLDLQLRG